MNRYKVELQLEHGTRTVVVDAHTKSEAEYKACALSPVGACGEAERMPKT